jgi:MarR-like DNA-binding transcriptional regulator SgrR of sgrS sRNA
VTKQTQQSTDIHRRNIDRYYRQLIGYKFKEDRHFLTTIVMMRPPLQPLLSLFKSFLTIFLVIHKISSYLFSSYDRSSTCTSLVALCHRTLTKQIQQSTDIHRRNIDRYYRQLIGYKFKEDRHFLTIVMMRPPLQPLLSLFKSFLTIFLMIHKISSYLFSSYDIKLCTKDLLDEK